MVSRRVLSIFVVSAIAASFSLAVATSLFTTFPSGQQQAIAQQDNTTAATATSTNQTMASASTNKTFYLFNTELEGLDEATAGIPHYIYSLPVIVANRGDSVTVNFFNIAETEEEETEEEEEGEATEEEGRHSFTINTPPYSVDIETAAGESGNATFTADEEGVFQYYCKYHPPTMRGQLVVLPPSSQGESSPAT